MSKSLYYWDYLQLDQILEAQHLESAKHGAAAHDEMLFIVTHQAYELWFKQILVELHSVCDILNQPVLSDQSIATVVHRLKRIVEIQKLLIEQLEVMKTMTAMDFLEFREYLVPASGFQSIQFRQIENRLGLQNRANLGDTPYFDRLSKAHQQQIKDDSRKPSLFELIEAWLSRMPLLQMDDYNFWQVYEAAVNDWLQAQVKMLDEVKQKNDLNNTIHQKQLERDRDYFNTLFCEDKYNQLRAGGERAFSRKAIAAALFINLYRDQPALQSPFALLSALVKIDELFTQWRYGHALMVFGMIGTKIGTGGSSGYDYLKTTAEKHKVFSDISNITTYIIPRHAIPKLPESFLEKLGFVYTKD